MIERESIGQLTKYGFNSAAGSERFNLVSALIGRRVAQSELDEQLASYEREFLRDEPISQPHPYYLRKGELYSKPVDHCLFRIKDQIDEGERDGAAKRGFESFERKIAQSQSDNEVFLWYSPEGRAGESGPYKDISYDAGRLYLAFKLADETVNFDIKIHPNCPVVQLLNIFADQAGNGHPEFEQNQQGKFHYLENPIATGLSSDDFFAFLEGLMKANLIDEHQIVYFAKRHSQYPVVHTISDIIEELKSSLATHLSTPSKPKVQYPLYDRTINSLKRQEDIFRLFAQRIAPYIRDEGGRVILYGCSTTSTVTAEDIFGKGLEIDGIFSIYSSAYRKLTGMEGETRWEYHSGTCVSCKEENTEVGPCDICKECE